MKINIVIALSCLISSFSYGAQFMIVQCYMKPTSSNSASYSQPGVDKMFTSSNCAEALNKVPVNFRLVSSESSSISAGSTTLGAAYINYLFSDSDNEK